MVDRPAYTPTRLSGWGGYPVETCDLYRPQSREDLQEIVRNAPQSDVVPRGKGRSYGDAALNESRGVILQSGLDPNINFDTESGIMECGASTSLAKILDSAVPCGFFLPITPGTKHISVGGAIAADVHGKNHHRDGTISGQLLDFRILTGTGDILSCSRQENPDLFWATLGGMGLTGAVLDARLQLRKTETAYVNARTERCRDLDEALERIARGDKDYEYAVAWIDCLARGRSLGRSILLRANPARVRDLPARMRSTPHANTRPFSLNMPFYWPSAVLNRFSMRMFNAALFRVHRENHSISHCNRYFYPLDRIGHWNRIYGKRGVLQYQLVLPRETAREGLAQILERTTRAGHGSFMAVLKSTGPANPAPLSFPIEGVSLALDFPNTGSDLLALLKTLDRTVVNHGGRVYLAKDSTLGPEDFRMMYPRLDEFRAVKEKYDPEMRFSSSQARRLRIVDAS